MVKKENQETKILEQIRNLLVLQLLKSGIATNVEISRALGVTAGRTSQMFSKITQKKPEKQKKKKK